MEEPRPEVDDIGIFNKYIVVTVKLDDETNRGGNIATMIRCVTGANGLQLDKHTTIHFWIPESMILS